MENWVYFADYHWEQPTAIRIVLAGIAEDVVIFAVPMQVETTFNFVLRPI